MKLIFKKGEIVLEGNRLTLLDKLVIDFISLVKVKYVIVSGYTAILFGRSRNTEDVDIFIERMNFERFSEFYNGIVLAGKYECINAEDPADAYQILTEEKSSIRFAEKGTFEPNFEVKFPQNELNLYSLNKAIVAKLSKEDSVNIGPLELQLAYKLYLGSEKDYLDAAHIYEIAKEHIDKQELKSFIKRLGIKIKVVKDVLGEGL